MLFNAIYDDDPLAVKHCLAFGECTSLKRPSDLGNSPLYLAIAKQKKRVLHLLFKEGLDFQDYCDKLRFGTPLYYAIWYGSEEMILELFKYDVDFTLPVNRFNHSPVDCARNLGKEYLIPLLEDLCTRRDKASITISSFFRMVIIRRWYLEEIRHRRAAIKIQSVARMYIFRKNFHILLEDRALQLFQASNAKFTNEENSNGSNNANRTAHQVEDPDGISSTIPTNEIGNSNEAGDGGSLLDNNTSIGVNTGTLNLSGEDTNTTSAKITPTNKSET